VKGLRQEEMKAKGSGLALGAFRPLIERKRVQGSGLKVQGCGAAHFVILSGGKRRMLKNGLSETVELSRRI
jgi:hypothetical protein